MTEQLSSLMDKKVDISNIDYILNLKQDQAVLGKWQRYNLASWALKGEVNHLDMRFDVARKVMSSLSLEADGAQFDRTMHLYQAEPLKLSRTLRALAVAVSLFAGIYLFIPMPDLKVKNTTQPQITKQSASTAIDWNAPNDVEARLNSLLVEHSEFTGVINMNGLAPYSKIVAYKN